ncbi:MULTISPECIES: TRAP transporter small permease [Thalassospira]|jgi:TRAP-type C4-dicarboxylate transport system permease small subunit|uniref:TRAP transporter small permease protein n=2 Tax=Thalassospira TaxID=168934 RepID=A0A367W1T3_9PROT|nr:MULTISPECIES: TRAP transporter small permease [Thalassospira]MDG4720346.1 TRAP transporter small permease [Thalassospira sp. FZY0004]RCK32161.1 C4-dicarboxylate ABC transporter substrate-binding protein [Thalassospira profundimaris]
MFERLMLLLAWAAAILFVLSGCMLTYEVIARYFFIRPTIWAAELSQLCLIWGSLLGMPWALAARRHISVDAVTRLFSEPVQRGIEIVAMLCVFAFSVMVTIKGWDIFYESFERGRTSGTMLDLPAWVAELPVALGFALLAIQAVIEVIGLLRGKEIPKGAHE